MNLALHVCYMEPLLVEPRVLHDLHVSRVDPDDPHGGAYWAFGVKWIDLGKGGVAPRVEMFSSGWLALVELHGFFAWLGSKPPLDANGKWPIPSLQEIVDELRKHAPDGFTVSGYWPEGCGVVGDVRDGYLPDGWLWTERTWPVESGAFPTLWTAIGPNGEMVAKHEHRWYTFGLEDHPYELRAAVMAAVNAKVKLKLKLEADRAKEDRHAHDHDQ